MKNQSTIWESASRPLFVRSVWLDSSTTGHTLQRHFILDYEHKSTDKRPKSDESAYRKKGGALRTSVSCDYSEPDDVFHVDQEDLLLIASAKLRLQHQNQNHFIKKSEKPSKNKRRWSTIKRHNFTHLHYIKSSDLFETYSRRSSLHDTQSSLSNACTNPEDRLAERVLNWLDLAGRTDILKNETPLNPTSNKEMSSNRKKLTTKLQKPIHSFVSINKNRFASSCYPKAQARTVPETKSSNRQKPHSNPQTNSCSHVRQDSLKHITIIFNKEGVPVRLNRPARNIDLCALSSSAQTTKRLAGPLASARLYTNRSDSIAAKKPTASLQRKHSTGKSALNGGMPLGVSPNKLFDDIGFRTVNDAKKQLHIFMPSLPKKGFLTSGTSVDDTNSALSNAFSELCHM